MTDRRRGTDGRSAPRGGGERLAGPFKAEAAEHMAAAAVARWPGLTKVQLRRLFSWGYGNLRKRHSFYLSAKARAEALAKRERGG